MKVAGHHITGAVRNGDIITEVCVGVGGEMTEGCGAVMVSSLTPHDGMLMRVCRRECHLSSSSMCTFRL